MEITFDDLLPARNDLLVCYSLITIDVTFYINFNSSCTVNNNHVYNLKIKNYKN